MGNEYSRSAQELLTDYGDQLYRTALVLLRNRADAEDAVQETMLCYLKSPPVFNDREHEKAWLLSVTVSKCRDIQRFRFRHPTTDIDLLAETLPAAEEEEKVAMDALLSVPEKYREVLTLHYVEEYKVSEIAQMLGMKGSAVKMRLKKGRELLEKQIRKERGL